MLIYVTCYANYLWITICSLLVSPSSSLSSLSIPSLLRCLINILLRTLYPLGYCALTRHNIRAGWPEKDPKQRRDRCREMVGQRVIMNGCSAGTVTRELNWHLGIGKTASELKAFPRMRQNLSVLQGCVGVLCLGYSGSHCRNGFTKYFWRYIRFLEGTEFAVCILCLLWRKLIESQKTNWLCFHNWVFRIGTLSRKC